MSKPLLNAEQKSRIFEIVDEIVSSTEEGRDYGDPYELVVDKLAVYLTSLKQPGKKTKKEKASPAVKKMYVVEVQRVTTMSTGIQCEAENEDEASAIAAQLMKDGKVVESDWDLTDEDTIVTGIYEEKE